jgi:hypothetical protein
MAMGMRNLVLSGLGALSLLGCKETVEGKFLDTEGIAVLIDVTAESEDSSRMEVDFVTGGNESNTYVNLSADEVTVGADGDEKEIHQSSKGEYETTFDTGAGGTVFTLALDRSDADKTDASENEGTLPEPFAVMLEPAGEVSRSEDLTVLWDPSGDADEVRIDVDGDCVFFTFESGEDDDGEFVIAANELILGGDPMSDDEGPCEVEVTVTKTNHGTTDETFDPESHFRLHQVRSATYDSVP